MTAAFIPVFSNSVFLFISAFTFSFYFPWLPNDTVINRELNSTLQL
jgi:hypothetical protein